MGKFRRHLGHGVRQPGGPDDIFPQRRGRWPGHEWRRALVVMDLAELLDKAHDALHLLDQRGQFFLCYCQLGEPSHASHVVPADTHALSQSRSSPA